MSDVQTETIELIQLADLANQFPNNTKGGTYTARSLANWADHLDLTVRSGFVNHHGAQLLALYYQEVASVAGRAQSVAREQFITKYSRQIATANSLMSQPNRYANVSENVSAAFHESEWKDDGNEEEMIDGVLTVVDAASLVLASEVDQAIAAHNEQVDQAADRYFDAVQNTKERFIRRLSDRAKEAGGKPISLDWLVPRNQKRLGGGTDAR